MQDLMILTGKPITRESCKSLIKRGIQNEKYDDWFGTADEFINKYREEESSL